MIAVKATMHNRWQSLNATMKRDFTVSFTHLPSVLHTLRRHCRHTAIAQDILISHSLIDGLLLPLSNPVVYNTNLNPNSHISPAYPSPDPA
jgi:hypothetical protein